MRWSAFIGFIFDGLWLRSSWGDRFDYAVQSVTLVVVVGVAGPVELAVVAAGDADGPARTRRTDRVDTDCPSAKPAKAVLKPDAQDQMGRERSLKALQSGQSDDEEVDHPVPNA